MTGSAVDGVVAHLSAAILRGEARPGDRLAEAALAARLEVSRNTIREAFRALGRDRLVEHLPNRGVFVRVLTRTEVRDVYQTRRILECGALREAAVRLVGAAPANPGETGVSEPDWEVAAAKVHDAVEEGRRAREAEDWGRLGTANGQFHLALAGLAGNEIIDRTLRILLTEMRLAFVVAGAREVHERYLDDNVHIASLVRRRELVRAAIALEDYLLRSERHLLAWHAEHGSP